MTEHRVQRRLAAILAADVVGYSRMMGRDEAGTLERLKSLRAELLHPKVEEYGGRVVKTTGDGTLIEFPSAVDAVSHAVDVQHALAERNADVPDDDRVRLRIGINVGDIIIDGDDIYGDGVNVAARLEGLAEPGGVCVSGNVHEHVRQKVNMSFEDLGERQVKNISDPVRVYRVTMPAALDSLMPRGDDLPLPDKPSIAVLPFVNMSGDTEQEYFSDGITEDIITDLSKISGLFVIARNSSFAYKGTSPDLRQVGRQLGVRHVLEGSVRKAGNRVRINAQLINADTGGHLWAERYDGELDDIFGLQDKITSEIVTALKLELTVGGRQRKERRPTENIEAYDLFLQARGAIHHIGRDNIAFAAKLLERAVELDPNFADAYAILGRTQAVNWYFTWRDDATLSRAVETARHAVALDDTSALAHVYLGWILIFERNFDEGVAELERAIELDPNVADGYFFLAESLNLMGRPEKSLEVSRIALRLNPLLHGIHVGHANYLLGNYDAAVAILEEAIERAPRHPMNRIYLAATYVEVGRTEEAKSVVGGVLSIAPNLNLQFLAQLLPYQDADTKNRLINNLRKAGLPE